MTKYYLAITEIYNPKKHGEGPKDLYTHFLSSMIITSDEFMEEYPSGYIADLKMQMNSRINIYLQNKYGENWYNSHPIINNYKNIINNGKDLSVEIVKGYNYTINEFPELNYSFCTLQTFWLKLLQRKWKKYYKNILLPRKNFKILQKRQITGKWN